jgi:hypothetical protein
MYFPAIFLSIHRTKTAIDRVGSMAAGMLQV